MIRTPRLTCLIALIGLSGFVYACGSGSSGGGTGGGAGTTNNNGNGGSNNNSGGSFNSGGSNSNNGGSTTNGGNSSSNGGSNAGSCDPAAAANGGDGCAAYSECMQENCTTEYEGCMGSNYQDGDFSGGSCETFLDCVVNDCECEGTCVQGCERDTACTNCFFALALSSCGRQNCSDELNECAGSQGAGGTNGGGGASNTGGSGGTGGIPGLSDATCADLQACCDSLSGDDQTSCQQTYDVVSGFGDIGCGAAIGAFPSCAQ